MVTVGNEIADNSIVSVSERKSVKHERSALEPIPVRSPVERRAGASMQVEQSATGSECVTSDVFPNGFIQLTAFTDLLSSLQQLTLM